MEAVKEALVGRLEIVVFFQLKNSCFTMLCYFQEYNKVIRIYVYIYILFKNIYLFIYLFIYLAGRGLVVARRIFSAACRIFFLVVACGI